MKVAPRLISACEVAPAARRRAPHAFAHRGASCMAPENTVLAFRLAIEAGVDALETDARLTADGEIVLLHDADLARTTDGVGFVGDARLADVQALDAGYRFAAGPERFPFRDLGLRVPTLAELFELLERCAPRLLVNVELKRDPADLHGSESQRVTDALTDWLRRADIREHVLVSSFDAATLERVRRTCPAQRTALLVGADADISAALDEALTRGHAALHPHHSLLGCDRAPETLLNGAHAAGIEVNVWTANDAARMRELADMGVDGVMSDNAQRLRATLDAWACA